LFPSVCGKATLGKARSPTGSLSPRTGRSHSLNPNTLKAQIEGGIGFALTNTLKSRITFSNGGAEQSNFSDYPLLRIDEMPEIVPIVLPSDRPPQGFGEVVLAPVDPALAQALFYATGRPVDVMPFPEDAFRANN